MMQYLVAFQVFAGFFSAFVAGRKRRSRVAWWLIGALVPVGGFLLSLIVPAARPRLRAARSGGGSAETASPRRRRPKRCCGSYIPDCFGCPHFRKQLFSANPDENHKGYCELFGEDLLDESKDRAPKLIIEDH